jgi:hypothetical protein
MLKHSSDTAQHFEVILNVLRPCGSDKTMCAWEWMHGAKYDFNRHPLLTVGMPVTVYDQPRTHPRGAWGDHGSPGHYVGPALDHYRCWSVLMPTGKIRVASTLECHPRDVVLPGASRIDRLTAALTELTSALRDGAGQGIPDASEEQMQQVRQLHAVFTERSAHRETECEKATSDDAAAAAKQQATTPATAVVPAAAGASERQQEAQQAPAPAAPTGQSTQLTNKASQAVASSVQQPPTATQQRVAPAPPATPQRVAGGGGSEGRAQERSPPTHHESTGPATLQRVAGGGGSELSAQKKCRTPAPRRQTGRAASPWSTIITPAPAPVPPARATSRPVEAVLCKPVSEEERSIAVSGGGTEAQQRGDAGKTTQLSSRDAAATRAPSGLSKPRAQVHFREDTIGTTKPGKEPVAPGVKAAVANAPPASPVRASGRHAAKKAKERARSAAAMAAVEAEATYAEDQAMLADAMLRAAAERADQEAEQMRREADALDCGVHRARLGCTMREMQAEHVLSAYKNPFTRADSAESQLRRLAERERESAMADSAHIAALLLISEVQDEEDDEGEDIDVRTGMREICPDSRGEDSAAEADGVAFGTVDDETGEAINLRKESKPGHKHAAGWHRARIEELERLIVTTRCMIPMGVDERMREGATVSYVAWAASYKYDDDKNPLHRIRGAYGGNVLKNKYVGETAAQTASLPSFKILLNAVLSTPGAKFMTLDLKDMYLQSDLEKTEYVAIPVADIPAESMTRHKLHDKVRNGRVYFKVDKAMYGLPQAGYIAQQDLGKLLRANGFKECPRTPQVYRHEERALTMSIVVDDFGVLYIRESDVDWLLKVLRTKYELKVDWTGEKYIGITLQWDYVARTCRMSMPDYVRKGVSRFLGDAVPHSITHGPAPYTQFKYGHQDAPKQDDSAPISEDRTKRVQALVGYFLYYARAVDPTMLVVLGQIASSQSKATEDVEAACAYFLHYAATYPNATIVYRCSDMFLRVVTDASFHSETNAGTRMGGVHFLGDRLDGTKLNGMIDTLCKLIDVVVASAAEAELGALFFNAKMATETRYMLEDFGFPQPPTPIECDNQCAVGIANGDVKLKRSRAMDVRFHWIADRVRQGQFVITWQKGSQNLADYFTKVHPAAHHRANRVHYVCDKILSGRTTSEMRRVKKAPRNVTQQVASYVKYIYSCCH